MTPDQIDQFPAGPDLDTLIAEKVMDWRGIERSNNVGWELQGYPPNPQKLHIGGAHRVPDYSTEIAAAWLVVERFESLGKRLILSNGKVSTAEIGWAAGFYYVSKLPIEHLKPIADGFTGASETAPLAICRAALKAVIGDKE